MTVELAPSRRERKKQATRQAIHEAAFTLAEEDGLVGVTVEAIAARADVATRTGRAGAARGGRTVRSVLPRE